MNAPSTSRRLRPIRGWPCSAPRNLYDRSVRGVDVPRTSRNVYAGTVQSNQQENTKQRHFLRHQGCPQLMGTLCIRCPQLTHMSAALHTCLRWSARMLAPRLAASSLAQASGVVQEFPRKSASSRRRAAGDADSSQRSVRAHSAHAPRFPSVNSAARDGRKA